MSTSVIYVGLDVHKDSIAIAVAGEGQAAALVAADQDPSRLVAAHSSGSAQDGTDVGAHRVHSWHVTGRGAARGPPLGQQWQQVVCPNGDQQGICFSHTIGGGAGRGQQRAQPCSGEAVDTQIL